MNKDKMKGNGFEQHKLSILQSIDDVKKVQEKHTEKLEELKLMVIERFGKMETSVAIIKTKLALYAAFFGGAISLIINVVVKYA